ncbi:hypothetical protein J4050_01345 [Winogradskyella sp. DF17]|uniref:Bulb-type lectin domain-containing protein n=1 Tax=Winogradskyella pelagia TaxID=2819984 RepID=A0ABS3SXZ5_9FLAO|nr:hypothetical protein [Winogradskyella sp. DF17]MBO3115370.1 hypothetical protein [Winogradskyella sp. DF17]
MNRRIVLCHLCAALLLITQACSNDDESGNGEDDATVESISTLGGSNNDSGRAIVATQDGGYAILGYTQSNDGDITDKQDSSFDYWLIKFNVDDTMEWQRTYGGSQDDRGRDIIQTSDGGYAILGLSFSSDGDVNSNEGLQDYWLAKLSPSGDIQWQKTFGYSGADSGISVIETNDNGFLLSGILDVTASGGEGNTSRLLNRHAGGDYWVLKLNGLGDIEWSQYFGGNFTDTPEGVVQTEDNGFIIAGGSDSNDTDISSNKGSYDFWVIRLSATGVLIWEKSFGGDQIDEARAIAASADGNYIVVGDTRSNNLDVSNNKGGADLWLIKISPEGNLIWENTLGGSNFDVGRSLKIRENGNLLLAGSSRSSDIDVSKNQGQNDAWILETNSDGTLLWEKSFGGSNIDFAYAITELSNGTIISTGDTSSIDGDIEENKGFSDMLIVKINY